MPPSRSRKHTAWRKSRRFGDVHGGRAGPKTEAVMRRFHAVCAPGPHDETPLLIEDNPSRDFYFPLSGEELNKRND